MVAPISRACNPQVLYRPDGQFFIRDPESGHTYPATLAAVVSRFGELFTECVERVPGLWVEFDADARAEQVRPPMPPAIKIAVANVAAVNAVSALFDVRKGGM